MRKNTLVVVVAVLSLAAVAKAQSPSAGDASDAAGKLPVKRVVLYKNGVGYFEHSTQVRGNQDLNIDFTSGQLDDALKSLTVVDLGGGHIQGVRFNSVAPLSERLKTLRLPLAENTSRRDFLNALRGTRVEVHSGSASAVGKLLSVETIKTFGEKDQEVQTTEVTLVTDDGDMRSFTLTPGASLRVADRELSDEVNRYLNLIGSAKAVDLRRLTISAAGTGEREIFVSYISEVPVWKSTYRILIDKDHAQNPLLQGWAVVDNTIGEDWNDVQLSLVAGAPQSFVQNISQPMYVQRPTVPLPEAEILTPETHEAAMMKLAPPPPPMQETMGMAGAQPMVRSNGMVIGGPMAGGGGGGGVGRGFGGGFLAGSGPGPGAPQPMSEAVEAETATAVAKTAGDYFEYNLKENVTIGKNQSALVPILQARVEAEKVTLWNEDSDTPRRALWLNNTSGTELDAGSFDILDDNTFAGEGMLDSIRPGEKRLISYAADSAIQVKTRTESSERPITHVVIAKGLMTVTREDYELKTYTVSNSDTAARDVIIEHPARDGWNLAKDLKPEETSASFHRFRLKVEPKTSAELAVEEFHPREFDVQLTNLDTSWIDLLTQEKRMTPAISQALKRVLDQKGVITGIDTQIRSRRQDADSITTDQGRIRENMKALKGSPEERALVQRYTQQLNSQEDRLAALHTQIADLQARRQKESDQLDKILEEIALDEKF